MRLYETESPTKVEPSASATALSRKSQSHPNLVVFTFTVPLMWSSIVVSQITRPVHKLQRRPCGSIPAI